MKLHEAKYSHLVQSVSRADGAEISVEARPEGSETVYIAKGGPFKGWNGVKLGPGGQLTPEQAEAVDRWFEEAGTERGEDGEVISQRELTPEEQMIQEGIQVADELYPGLGGSLMNIYSWIKTLPDSEAQMLQPKHIFSLRKGDGSVLWRAMHLQSGRRPIISELDAQNMTIVEAVHTDYNDHAKALTSLFTILKTGNGIGGVDSGVQIAALRAVSELVYYREKKVIEPIDKRRRSKSKSILTTGQWFFRSSIDGNLRGVSLNLPPRNPLQLLLEKSVNRIDKVRQSLREEGIIGEDEYNIDSVGFDGLSIGGGNLSEAIKNLSEEGEVSLFNLMSEDPDLKAQGAADMKKLITKYRDVLRDAMELNQGALDRYADEALDMAAFLGGDDPGIAKEFLQSLLERRSEFMRMMKPDSVIRVGAGDVGVGFKPDCLYIYNEKPSHIPEEYLLKQKDGKWAVGVSLKTYTGRHGTDTKLGGTHSIGTLTSRLVKPPSQWDSHTKGVVSQLGFNSQDVRDIRQEAEEVGKINSFARSIATGEALKIKGLTGAQARGVVTDQLLRTMDHLGIDMPKGFGREEIENLCKGAGLSGGGKVSQVNLSRLSVHLEKELNMRRIREVADENGNLDVNNPRVKHWLFATGSGGLDTQWGADVMNSTVLMQQRDSFHSNQDGKIRKAISDAREGKHPVTFTAGGRIKVGPCIYLNLNNESNRVSMATMTSSKEGCR